MMRPLLALGVFMVVGACGGSGSMTGDAAPGGGLPDGLPGFGNFPDPAGFTAMATSETSVALSWQAVPDALGYILERRSGGDEFMPIAAPTTTSYVDEGLATDTEYTYRLRALGLAGFSMGVERTVRTGDPGPGGGGTSSFDRIDEARASGALDTETAIEYKAFALFKDPRLPAAYRGDDSEVFESDALDGIYEAWATLSPAAQQILEPFLMPPAYVGSWASPAGPGAKPAKPDFSLRTCNQPAFDPNWASKPATNQGRVKVWYDTRVAGQNTKASTVLAAVEDEIWPRLVGGLGMREPLSDAAVEGCNGGDGRLDIYLVDMASQGQGANDYGANLPVDYAWKHRPAFLLLNHNLSDKQLKGTAAHEFMHASQWAYPVAGIKLSTTYAWLKESTAQWAIDYVYPTEVDNFEQIKVQKYEDKPDEPLDTQTLGSGHVYGSYLFFQFLAKTLQPGLIKDIWEKTIGESDETKAVDSTIPGGFKEQWPKFAKLLWNQDPVNGSSFETWDKMMLTPELRAEGEVKLNGQPSATIKLNGNIKHLSTQYYRFVFADSNIRSVSFLNHFFAVNKVEPYRVSVQAFYKKEGSIWEWEHWSDEGMKELTKPFCLDVVKERLVELVVVMSNDSAKDDVENMPESIYPRLSVSNVGCWRWKGTSSVTTKVSSPSAMSSADFTADATVTFERAAPDPSQPSGNTLLFWVHDGAATGSGTGSSAGCTTTQTAAGPVVMLDGSLTVNQGLDLGAPPSRDVFMTGGSQLFTHTTLVCPKLTTMSMGDSSWGWLEDPAGQTVVVKPDGTIQGSNTEPFTGDPTGSKTVVWSFSPLRQ